MTRDLATLRDLQSRVLEATGPTRELDARLWQTIVNGATEFTEGFGYSVQVADDVGHPLAPRLTANIDEAVAFVERVLPRHEWYVNRDGAHMGDVVYFADVWNAAERKRRIDILADTPALALLSALLAALVSQTERSAATSEMALISQELDLP